MAGDGGHDLVWIDVDQCRLEVDQNRNFLAGTRNQPGIRFPVLVPGFEIFDIYGYWFGYWFRQIPIFLGDPGSPRLIPGQTGKFLVRPGRSWCYLDGHGLKQNWNQDCKSKLA